MKRPIKTLDRTLALRMRTYDIVSAAIRATGEEAAGILDTRYPASAEGEPTADYPRVFADLSGELEGARLRMLDVNTRHQGQLARVVDFARRRDELTKELLEHFIRVRHSLENLYGGVRGFTVVGVTGPTLRDPAGVLKQVRETVDFLSSPKVSLPPVEGFDVDHTRVSERLASGAEGLEAMLTEHAEGFKQAEATRLMKNDAIKAYDRTFLYVTRTVSGLFHIAGLHDAAERVRPSERRPGPRAEDETEEEDPATAEDGSSEEVTSDSGG